MSDPSLEIDVFPAQSKDLALSHCCGQRNDDDGIEFSIFVAMRISQDESLFSRCQPAIARSEEHTSELQSLMRISYAVFCLKKHQLKFKNESNITTGQSFNLIYLSM